MPAKKPQFNSLFAIESELQSIQEKASVPETEESWDSIAKGLQRFTFLIQNASLDFPTELSNALRGLARPVNNAAASERSRLSGAAVDLLKTSAESLGKQFTALIPLFLPTLLTLCARPNKVFITRAKTCIMTIIEATHSPTILSYLAESIKDKTASSRLAAAESALVCLNSFNPPDLEKEARSREIEALIKSTAVDASADVRKVGKKLFEAYRILLPHRVDNFTAPLTPTIRKYLDIRSRVQSNSSSNPPSRPASSQSMHSVHSAHAITRPKSTIPPSSTTPFTIGNLARSIGSDTLIGAQRTRSASSNSAPLSRSESAPVNAKPIAVMPRAGPSRPQPPAPQKGPSRVIQDRDMPPPQIIPFRAPPPTDAAPNVAGAILRPDFTHITAASSGTTQGPKRLLFHAPSDSGPQPHRVIGGARRVPLPPPPEPTPVVPPKERPEPANLKSAGSTHVRTTSASSRTEVKPPSVIKPEEKLPPKPKAQKKVEPTKVRSQPPPPNEHPTTSSCAVIEGHPVDAEKRSSKGPRKPEGAPPPAVTSRRKGATGSRLTEPTQAQLAKQKSTKTSSVEKKDPAKRTWGRPTSSKNVAPKAAAATRKPVLPATNRSKTPSVPEPPPGGVVESSEPKVAPALVPLPPSRSPTPPVRGEVEEVAVEEVVTIEESDNLNESSVPQQVDPTVKDSPLSAPAEPLVEEPWEDEDLPDEPTITPNPSDSIHLITFDSPAPSTPKAIFPRMMQQVPETPITALLASIQNGLELSPAPPFDPDQTYTFGGLLQIERCEPLLIGHQR